MTARQLRLASWLLILFTCLLARGEAATFRWASDGDLQSLDPYTRNETFQLAFLSNVYEPLVRRDRNLKLQPALAERWEQVSPVLWRFYLRKGVKWQDGSPFTADDVVFSAVRVRAPTSMIRVVLARVREVRKVDPLTVEIETTGPDPILPAEITTWVMMSETWSRQHQATEPVNLALGVENYAVRHAMGTGPYGVVQREPDRRTVVERNPTWWDRSPRSNVDRAELFVIANPSTRVAALLSGEVDMLYSVPTQAFDRLRNSPGFALLTRPELRTIFVGLQQGHDVLSNSDIQDRNPLRDVRVREAFALAIDAEAIVRHIMRGYARPAWLMWAPGVNGYNPALDVRPKADPDAAKRHLAEAGYPTGFTLGMDCPNDRYVNDEAICTAITAMLARIGVTVKLDVMPRARFFAKIGPPAYDTDMFLLGYTPNSDDALEVLQNFAATRKPPLGELNFAGFSDPAMDALIGRIAAEADYSTGRNHLTDEAALLLQRKVAYIPLHQSYVAWAVRDGIDVVQRSDNFLFLPDVRVN